MTTDRDFDRIARAWLESSPDEAPDRTIAAVLDAVATTPQERTWQLALRRLQIMNRPFIAAVVAGALVVAIGGGFWLSRAAPAAVSGVSVPPSSSAIPSPLQVRWYAGPRPVPGIQPGSGVSIAIGPGSVAINPSNQHDRLLLGSDAAIASDGRLRLQSAAPSGGCQTGDVGLYAWSLSPSGQTLTIAAGSDACATRLATLPGTWWSADCKIGDTCLGPMDAGTYGSQFIDPSLGPAAFTAWAPRFAALGFTVPDGWSNSADWPSTFVLTPTTAYATETQNGPPDGVFHEIMVFAQASATLQGDACGDTPDSSVGRTVDTMVAWLEHLPSIATTAPTAITIDGHSGQMLDITVDPAWRHVCPGDAMPSVELLASATGQPDQYGIGIVKGQRERLILLDLGNGAVAGILVNDRNDRLGPDPARFDSLANAAMPIIRSFTFR